MKKESSKLTPQSSPVAVAWHMAGDDFRIQTNTPEATKAIAKIPGARRVGYSVTSRHLRLFDFVSNAPYIRRITEEIGGVFLSESPQGDNSSPGGCR